MKFNLPDKPPKRCLISLDQRGDGIFILTCSSEDGTHMYYQNEITAETANEVHFVLEGRKRLRNNKTEWVN